MHISVTDAKAHLTELVRRAEAGEEIVFTRHGQPVARLSPAEPAFDPEERRRVLAAVRGCLVDDGPSAARSQDYLYDDNGLPA